MNRVGLIKNIPFVGSDRVLKKQSDINGNVILLNPIFIIRLSWLEFSSLVIDSIGTCITILNIIRLITK